jgi:hypothetical protein
MKESENPMKSLETLVMENRKSLSSERLSLIYCSLYYFEASTSLLDVVFPCTSSSFPVLRKS